MVATGASDWRFAAGEAEQLEVRWRALLPDTVAFEESVCEHATNGDWGFYTFFLLPDESLADHWTVLSEHGEHPPVDLLDARVASAVQDAEGFIRGVAASLVVEE